MALSGGGTERRSSVAARPTPARSGSGLLERGPVLDAAAACLEGARAGRGAALLILGGAGLGKTSVLERVLHDAAAGMDVGLARGERLEAGLAFGIAREVLGELVDFDHETVSDSAAWYYRVLRALRGRSDRPLLLAVDDLHWSDPDSVRLLAFLARRLDGLPVALIGTLRPWPRDAADVCAGLEASGHARIEPLAPLSRQGAAALLAEGAGVPIAECMEQGAWRLCAGNPLLVGELARAVAGGERVPDTEPDGGGSPSGFAATFLLSRFAGVEPAALELARAGSVLGGSFGAELAGAVAGLDEKIDRALESLSGSGLLVDHEGRTRFAHALFAEALYDDLSPPVRRRLHERAFRILAARDLEPEAAAHAIAADLVGDRQAGELLARVGHSALAAGAVTSAVRLLEAAARLAGERAPATLTVALAEALIKAGRVTDARGVLDPSLASRTLEWRERYAALRVHAQALSMAGSFELSEQEHEQAATLALEHECPTLALEPLLDQTHTEWHLRGPGVAIECAARARAIAGGGEGPLRDRAEAWWAKIAFQTGDPSGLATALAIAARLAGPARGRRAGPEELVFPGNTLDQVAELAIMAERFDEAERALGAVVRAAEPAGALNALCTALSLTGEALTRRGRLVQALDVFARLAVSADMFPTVLEYLELFRAETLLWLGRLEESEASLQIAERGLTGLWYPALRISNVRGTRLLWQGDARASEIFLEAEEITRQAGIREPCVVCWAGHAIDAHLAFGRTEDATRVLAWLTECADALPCAWPRAAADQGRAALAARDGEQATAIDCYEQALSKLEPTDRPLQRVEALLAYGGFLRRHGRPRDARAPLALARQLAETHQAAWLAEQARRELQLAGGRRRRPSADRDQLTDAERRVAELAAAGHTNAQIARQLYVSISTIETHLRHVYGKFGIGSRRELQAHAPDFEAPQP
jgi:DNA-binding CsgD family transcriptional regulator